MRPGTPLSSLSPVPASTYQSVVLLARAWSLASHDSRFLTIVARTETEGFSLVLQSSAVAPN